MHQRKQIIALAHLVILIIFILKSEEKSVRLHCLQHARRMFMQQLKRLEDAISESTAPLMV